MVLVVCAGIHPTYGRREIMVMPAPMACSRLNQSEAETRHDLPSHC